MAIIDPRAITVLRTRGTGNIDESLGLNEPFIVAGLRIHFVDINSGATTLADVTLSFDSAVGSDHDVDLRTLVDRGLNADVNFQIDPMIYNAWLFGQDDKLAIAWANPDAGKIGYGMQLSVAPLAKAFGDARRDRLTRPAL